MNPYGSLSDDFGVYIYLNTKMELPTRREAVLHFFDSLQKTFPSMTAAHGWRAPHRSRKSLPARSPGRIT